MESVRVQLIDFFFLVRDCEVRNKNRYPKMRSKIISTTNIHTIHIRIFHIKGRMKNERVSSKVARNNFRFKMEYSPKKLGLIMK